MGRTPTQTVHKASTTQLPSHKTLQKRPLLHAPIASPKASPSVPKVIYVSSKSSHAALIKRIDGYLTSLSAPVRDKKGRIVPAAAKGREEQQGVTLKATGFAICAALAVGNVFLERRDCKVEVRTTSVPVVDDVVDRPEGMVGKEFRVRKRKKCEEGEKMEGKGEGEGEGEKMELDGENGEDEEVDMVTRVTSGVEIFICRKKEDT